MALEKGCFDAKTITVRITIIDVIKTAAIMPPIRKLLIKTLTQVNY